MDLTTVLPPVAGLLTLVCVVPYLADTLRGRTKPQRTSWFVFASLALIAALSQAADGSTAGAWLTGAATLGFAAVFLASLKHGVGGHEWTDFAAVAVAVGGLVVWRTTGEPFVVVLATIVAEVGAIGLTVAKAYRDPDSETASTWLIDAAAGAVAAAGVADWTFHELAYPIHHLTANAAVLAAILIGRRTALLHAR